MCVCVCHGMCVCVFLFPLEGGSEEEYATDRDYLIGNHDFVGFSFSSNSFIFWDFTCQDKVWRCSRSAE